MEKRKGLAREKNQVWCHLKYFRFPVSGDTILSSSANGSSFDLNHGSNFELSGNTDRADPASYSIPIRRDRGNCLNAGRPPTSHCMRNCGRSMYLFSLYGICSLCSRLSVHETGSRVPEQLATCSPIHFPFKHLLFSSSPLGWNSGGLNLQPIRPVVGPLGNLVYQLLFSVRCAGFVMWKKDTYMGTDVVYDLSQPVSAPNRLVPSFPR